MKWLVHYDKEILSSSISSTCERRKTSLSSTILVCAGMLTHKQWLLLILYINAATWCYGVGAPSTSRPENLWRQRTEIWSRLRQHIHRGDLGKGTVFITDNMATLNWNVDQLHTDRIWKVTATKTSEGGKQHTLSTRFLPHINQIGCFGEEGLMVLFVMPTEGVSSHAH